MANRRMFSLDVVNTDIFLDLPISSQALYFHLGMRADDDGFISSPRRIIAMISAAQDDLKILIAKGFVIALEGGLVVIRHWKQNNYLQSDRYKKTIYQEQMNLLEVANGTYNLSDTLSIQDVSEMYPQDSIGKNSIDEISIDKSVGIDYQEIIDKYNSICVSLPKVERLTDKRKKAIKVILKKYSLEELLKVFEMTEDSDFLKGTEGSWKASFDWLIKEANIVKVLEGNYTNRKKTNQSNQSKNSFNNFQQNDYDFEALEKELLCN